MENKRPKTKNADFFFNNLKLNDFLNIYFYLLLILDGNLRYVTQA